MLISLRNCDCLEYMWALPDGYFDCVIADPPYGIGRDWEKRDWLARAIFIGKDGKEQMGSASTDYYECDFPDWALCYLVNDDPSALSDEDKAEADAFLDGLVRQGYKTAYPEVTEDKNEFCPYPAFGKACGTVKVRFRK